MTAGRPSSYNEEVQRLADEYVDGGWIELGDAVPSTVGLADFLDVAKQTLYNWRDTYPEFLATFSKIETKQHRSLITRGLTGDYNAAIVKLMLANHGYSEKTQTELSGPDGKAIETDNTFRITFV